MVHQLTRQGSLKLHHLYKHQGGISAGDWTNY